MTTTTELKRDDLVQFDVNGLRGKERRVGSIWYLDEKSGRFVIRGQDGGVYKLLPNEFVALPKSQSTPVARCGECLRIVGAQCKGGDECAHFASLYS